MVQEDTAESATERIQSLEVAAFMQRSFVDMFLAQSRRSQVGLLLGAALMTYTWWRATGGAMPIAWFALAIAVTVWRYFFTQGYVRSGGGTGDTQRIVHLLILNGVLLSLPLLAFVSYTDLDRAVLTMILVVVAAGSVVTTLGYRSLFLAFALPMFLSLAIAWLAGHGSGPLPPAAQAMPVLLLAFLVVLIGVGKQAARVFEDSCQIRFGERGRNAALAQALAHADEANRAKTQFLAAASHDLRQPIHSLNVLVAALAQRPLDERSREIVNLLGSVNQTLSAELDGLLEISKLDAGAVLPVLTHVRLDQLLAAHHATIEPLAEQAGVRCVLQVENELPVHSDATLLTRVLGNLTGNALKFTPRGGEVRLLARRVGSHAEVTVSDTGIGIAAQEHERVFQEFYQVGNVERDRTRGLGLGLSIVKRSCDLLGVRVHLKSVPGQGTSISLQMRLQEQAQDLEAAPLAPPSQAPLTLPKGLRVLVIDDEIQVRQSMQLLLSELGCEVFLADGTEQANAVAQSQALDAVLSDFRMRGADGGLAALAAVRTHHPAITAALITGDTAPHRITQARWAGVPLLHKPVALPALLSVLRGDTKTISVGPQNTQGKPESTGGDTDEPGAEQSHASIKP